MLRQRTETGRSSPTASDVLFSDDMERYFFALKDRDGKRLWKASLSASVDSAAHDLRDNGRQFVAVACDVRLCLPQQ
jgi:glucose dehydrogenase